MQPTENAAMSELDSYLEYLYDDMQSKIRGTGLILQLARSPDNLCYLMENGTHAHLISGVDLQVVQIWGWRS